MNIKRDKKTTRFFKRVVFYRFVSAVRINLAYNNTEMFGVHRALCPLT